MTHEVTFWGVRGSIPSPGTETAGVGGNTTCVEVRFGDERILLDGGSGLRALAMGTQGAPVHATLLFSHYHWDHIQGVPFFVPLFHPDTRMTLYGPEGLRTVLTRQMSGPTFPVGMDALQARIDYRVIRPGDAFTVGDVRVRTASLHHPGGAVGYRLEHGGRAVVYGLDHEHGDDAADARLVELASGADLQIFDAMYLPDEYPQRVGWGHSTWADGVQLARRAGVRHLALTHHDPTRSDEAVADLEAAAQAEFVGAFAAREEVIGLDGAMRSAGTQAAPGSDGSPQSGGRVATVGASR